MLLIWINIFFFSFFLSSVSSSNLIFAVLLRKCCRQYSRMSSAISCGHAGCDGFLWGRVGIWTVAFQVGSWLLLIIVWFSTSFSIYIFFTCTFARREFLLMYGPDDILLILKCFNKWVWVGKCRETQSSFLRPSCDSQPWREKISLEASMERVLRNTGFKGKMSPASKNKIIINQNIL